PRQGRALLQHLTRGPTWKQSAPDAARPGSSPNRPGPKASTAQWAFRAPLTGVVSRARRLRTPHPARQPTPRSSSSRPAIR
ncbi:hypothetical protein QU39_00250, partial [Staphylococcus aureus]